MRRSGEAEMSVWCRGFVAAGLADAWLQGFVCVRSCGLGAAECAALWVCGVVMVCVEVSTKGS